MSREAEVLASAQMELYGRISRTVENLRKLGTSKITLGAVESRLQSLEAIWQKFDSNNDNLFAYRATLAGHEYLKQDVASLAEEAHLSQKATLLDLLRSSKESSGPKTASLESTIVPSRTTLPRIQLPSFSGAYEDWPAFRDLFISIIGKDGSTSQVEKLHYLKASLKGEAELLVRNLPTTSENYDRAWKALTDHYENKRLLVRGYISQLTSLQKLKGESASSITA